MTSTESQMLHNDERLHVPFLERQPCATFAVNTELTFCTPQSLCALIPPFRRSVRLSDRLTQLRKQRLPRRSRHRGAPHSARESGAELVAPHSRQFPHVLRGLAMAIVVPV